jgi:hypothetical protein
MVDIYSFNNNTTSTTETFKFTFSACPSFKLSFDRPDIPVTQQQPFKRRRALSDVDGDSSEGRKKRRLRLQLITSRLSRPFSQPASNIVVRGTSKVVLWGAGKRRPGVLRKAAIMNLIRKKMDAAKDIMRMQHERSHAAIKLKEISSHKQPRTASFLLPPSPLGLSNYDALDLEDNAMVDDDDGDSEIYSDFNVMNPNTADSDDFEYLDALDGLSSEVLPDTPPLTPSEEGIVEMLKEQETDGGSFFVEMRD